ncbi:MAG: 4Fe-4S binding protein [Gammaproteobacteria bacterium]|nr:4Fe-4S binding protein [Gammaproteobacteria bacterium]MDH3432355.1 4Fe-4S binding protein [Gammaproteobacteria bacterium]
MAGLRNIAIRWYRDVFGAPAGSDIREEGLNCVLDGNSAVALSEAGMASHAVLGGSLPSADSDAVWLDELDQGGTNLFGEALSAQTTEGPRGIVAAATGLALAGRRATAFLSGTDIGAAQDLLISAAGKHAPLVLHVATRAAAAHGAALGSGHETVHLSADAGFFLLFASNVQEAVDFTYIARRVAEESLLPGMVLMDGEQTALAVQDVRLLSPAQVNGFIGAAREQIVAPTAAQKLLFGEMRRRVPAWHDLDEPVLIGALFEKESFALGALARRPFFDAFVEDSLRASFELFARKTGRHYDTISRYRLDDAKTVLVAQGAAVETARVAADCLRNQHRIKVGVVGIHTLRPFPGADIVAALEGRDRVFVLERTDAAMAAEPPLTRELRASMDRLGGKRPASCSPVVYGVGGLPLRVTDLVELCTRADTDLTAPLFLGLAFDDTSGEQPKRAVLLDALRRAYPNAAESGIRAAKDASVPNPKNSLTIAIRRGKGDIGLLGTTAALLHALEGGRVRSRPGFTWERWSATDTDWLTCGDETLHDPGDDLVADVTVDVVRGEIVIGSEARTFRVPLENDAVGTEALLGGLFGVLIKTGLLDHKTRRIIAARNSLIDADDENRSDKIMADFQAGLEQLVEADSHNVPAAGTPDRWQGEAPAAVRHLGRNDDNFASLPRFWDQTGVLYRDGRTDSLTADPFLATGTMPPLSSTFNDTSNAGGTLPTFDPTLCTGCGKCWTHCPDSAIGVVASTPAALIDAGISRTGAEPVRQIASKLASRIVSSSRKSDAVAPTFGQLLEDAYAWLNDKMPLPEERKQAIQEGVEKITAALGALPVAVTEPFFSAAEARKKDSAELLSVVINPEACKACGICVSACEPEALLINGQDAVSVEQARQLWSVFSTTPDTPSESLERVAEHPDVGKMAAILLSRYCQFALAGGDPAEAGSGEKMAVRLILSATEFHQQPIVQRFAKSLAEAGESVSALINETLSSTLAVEDLDAVTEKLKRTTSPRVDLKDLAEGVGNASGDHSIDTDHLLRLIELSNRITAAQHRLVEGKHGLGRARYGLTVAGGSTAAWAGAFPHNPFQAPVLVDMTGDAAQLAAGLVEGHLDETTELIRLLRLARIEIDQPDGADWKREALASLQWKDLSDEELDVSPPLVLLGSDEMLAGQGLSQLIWLLNSGLPVKVLVLSELDVGDRQVRRNNPRGHLALLALAQRNAFVAQTSIADPVHLGESMLQALRYEGPALIQVYAPSPSRHGFPSGQTIAQARLAVASRALPLFRYDPNAEGVFGLRISLDGNPASGDTLAPGQDGERLLTLADWALGQERFASAFKPLTAEAAAPTPFDEWLQLDAKGRKGKTPYIATGDDEEEKRYAVSQVLADTADQCLANWRTLQELAGIVTPFTERLEQEIRAQLADEHQAALDAQKQASAAEIRQIQEKTQAEIASKIRSRLLQLASQKRD